MKKYTFKARVKKLIIDKCEKKVAFNYSDTVNISNKSYGIAYSNIEKTEEVEKPISKTNVVALEETDILCTNCAFEFISQHSKEELIITIKNTDKGYLVDKVELCYE